MWRTIAAFTLLIAVADTAGAQTIYPAGGKVQQTPTLWISATRMPAIEVTNQGGPVLFEIDELQLEHGLRRIALRPQVAEGPFTVTLDGKPFRFEADSSLDREDDEYSTVEFRRVAVERIRGRDTLVVDALAEPNTILYFLNHSSPRSGGPDVFARYVWVGPGKTITPGEDGANGTQRFELALSELGVSCASTRSIEVSPYTTHPSAATTLHPIGKLELARGEVKLPIEMLGQHDVDQAWQPCIGAEAEAPVLPIGALVDPAIVAQPIGSGPGFTDHSAAFEDVDRYRGLFDDADIYGGLLGRSEERSHERCPACTTAPIDERGAPWWVTPLALAGIALVLWRAAARVAA